MGCAQISSAWPRSGGVAHGARDGEHFDAIAEPRGGGHVGGVDAVDAADGDLVERRAAESDAGEQGDFVRGVAAADIEARVGFGESQFLRQRQGGAKIVAVLHARKDEVRSAVDDAGDFDHAIGGERLAQGFDDGNAAGDGGFEKNRNAGFLRARENVVAVFGEQRFVGGDDRLAEIEGAQDRGAGGFLAADEFDDGVRLADFRRLAASRRRAAENKTGVFWRGF